MKIEVGMYARYKDFADISKIAKITKIEFSDDDCYEDYYHFDNRNGTVEGSIEKTSFKLGELLKVGDFIDHQYISKIVGSTIYTYDGWFIDVDDIEDLVSRVVTKEQFEQMSYRIGGK